MFTRLKDSIKSFFLEETLKERSERMIPGALLGLIAGTAYVLVRALINVVSLPALHLSLDWLRLLTNFLTYALALALVGAIAGWFTEIWSGAIGGGIVSTLVYLLVNWIILQVRGSSNARIVQLFITSIPLLVGAMALCGLARFVSGRYARSGEPLLNGKRGSGRAGLVALVILAGMIPGLFSRFDQPSQTAIQTMDQRLQQVATDPTLLTQFPLAKFPALKDHFGMHFVLYPRSSSVMPSALDVTIRYADGYTLTCLVPTSDPYVQYFAMCYPGNNVNLP